ncbi:MAG: hypothetical protein NDP24_02345 [Crenarchaeota archaeon]|nr:hypothetical protein [Thermoproteota archaeon]MCR8471796.1 hypothetical protein [Thermoproteota archaeon]MCR8488599.1 hypothetical protein [Thermoproteota archaeon]
MFFGYIELRFFSTIWMQQTTKTTSQKEVFFAVSGKYSVLGEFFASMKPFYMVESDLIDDPKIPGVPLYL